MKRYLALALCLLLCIAEALAEDVLYADHGGVRVFESKGRVGLADSAGWTLLPAEYDEIAPFEGGDFAVLRRDGDEGVVRRDGTLALDCVWEEVKLFPEGCAAVAKDGGQGAEQLVDLDTGKTLLEADAILWKDERYIYAMTHGYSDPFELCPPFRTQVYDGDMRQLFAVDAAINTRLDWGFTVQTGAYFSGEENYGLVDLEGRTLLKDLLSIDVDRDGSAVYIRYEGDAGFCGVLRADGSGFEIEGYDIERVDEAGLYRVDVAPPTSFEDFGTGLERDPCWGYADASGAWVLPPRYQYAGAFVNGAAVVAEDGTCRLVDLEGRRLGEAAWDLESYLERWFGQGSWDLLPILPVASEDGVRLVNRRGEYAGGILPELDGEEHEEDSFFHQAERWLVLRSAAGEVLVYDGEGRETLRMRADDFETVPGPEPLLWLEVDGRWGQVIAAGENAGAWRIPPDLPDCPMPEGEDDAPVYYVLAEDDDHWYYLNLEGERLGPMDME